MAYRLTLKKSISISIAAAMVAFLVSCNLVLGEPTLSGNACFVSSGVKSESIDGTSTLLGSDGSDVLESYSFKLEGWKYKGDIAYRSFIQETGWQGWKPGGETSGTSGEGKAICGVQIMLTGHVANYYDINYRVNLQNSGWQEWVSNGTVSGPTEEPVIGLEVKLEEKQGEIRDTAWTITEFGDDDGRQSEFYTIRNNDDGTLIVIDGGWDANTEQVRSIINLFGGSVDYWFLTHYDADHVSAFNNIYADPQGITIGTIYATPLDYDLYCSYAAERWWDTPEVYKLFLDQTAEDDSVVYLNRDDSFEVAGLRIDVYNTFDQMIVDMGSPDVANYGSLMFKITGKEDTFLVCGDVYGQLWVDLAALYGEELESDYVQLGHHGNNHVAPEEWAVVNAKVAFFDGPAWLTESDDYDAKPLAEWCQTNGVVIFDYGTAPNSVPFE